MKNFLKELKGKALAHKFISVLIAALVIWGGYYIYGKLNPASVETRYVLAAVSKGTLVVAVTGSGQVSALDQADVKPKVSGDVVYVGVKNGDTVKTGTLLVKIDTTNAEQAVSDAETSLGQINLNLQKMKGLTTDAGTIRSDKQKAEDALAKVYDDGFNTISNAFLDLPGVMSGLQDTLYGTTLGGSGQWNSDYYVNAIQNVIGSYPYQAYKFRDDANATYGAARVAYDANFSDYKLASRFSDTNTIDKLIDETYVTTQLIAEAVKSSNNLIQLYKDRLSESKAKTLSAADTYLSQLSTYTAKVNSYLSSLLSAKTTIQNDKEAIINVGFNVADQEIKVAQAKRALADAKDTLAECYVRSPFAGTVAEVNVKKGDSVSSGSAVATILTPQQVANVTLNEVDVAKVKVGQKATLTFDAALDVTIAGEVTNVDSIGTVSQGVVSYTIEIAFTTNDGRIKSGMSVSAAIITDVKQDVLTVPNAAVKSQSGSYYVEVMDNVPGGSSQANLSSQGIASNVPPRQEKITAGISNNLITEVANGLNGEELVVVRVITGAVSVSQTQTSGLGGLRVPGLGGGR
ncbi:HlyD family efflux transporter periplasmic adaptor subunit [bacterium]|nr:MAG: HlyD family efflux transporter periplasmic adaptor subunit [bacterium]